jgi:hypothetical protein
LYLGCGDDNATMPDSSVADAAPDAPSVDASPYCQVPANDANQGHNIIYLNYEGVQLHACSGSPPACPDPSMDKTPIIGPDGGNVPPFDATLASRQQYLNQVTLKIQQVLAPYDVDIVTTRPASGDYVTIVFGGTCAQVVDPSCSSQVSGIGFGACGAAWSPSIGLVFDTTQTSALAANIALFDLATAAGLSCSTTANNCANCMSVTNQLCSFSASAGVNTARACTGVGATEDQLLMLKQKLGCR